MKITKKRSLKKFWIAGAIVAVLLAGGGGAYYYYARPKPESQAAAPTNTINYDEPDEDQKTAGSDVKQEAIDAANGKGGQAPPPAPSQPSTPPSAAKKQATATLTQAAQDHPGETLIVRALLQVKEAGTCNLELKNGQTVVTKTAPISILNGFSTCQGFDVARNELTPGIWQLTLRFSTNQYEGSASTQVAVQ